MNSPEPEIRQYYSRPDLYAAIISILDRSGPGNLHSLDEFHIGGHRATGAFLSLLGFHPGMSVLDIGSGLGGPARHAAGKFGVLVSGIDLTQEYVDTADRLSHNNGFGGRTVFQCASALSLPYPDEHFDAAYTIHTSMNIGDKSAMLREARRVLKPGALLGFYDVFRGTGPDAPVYPLPWAGNRTQSFLETHEEFLSNLQAAGLAVTIDADTTPASIEALEKLGASPGAPGLHLLLGDDFREKTINLLTALKSRACATRMIVTRKI